MSHISHLDVITFRVADFCGEQEEPFCTVVLLLEMGATKNLNIYMCTVPNVRHDFIESFWKL